MININDVKMETFYSDGQVIDMTMTHLPTGVRVSRHRYNGSSYKLSIELLEELDRLVIMHEFGNKMLDNMKDLEPEFVEVVDKHYWELLE